MPRQDGALSDEELIANFYASDTEALGVLAGRYYGALVVFFSRLGLFHDDALDLTQQVLLRIMLTKARQVGQFDPAKASFKTWMYRIASNLGMDLLQRNGRFVAVETDDEDGTVSLIERTESRDPKPMDVSQMEGFADAVSECWSDLPSHYQAAFVLFYFAEVPVEEIGRTLGKTATAIQMLLHHAREKLRRGLKQKNYYFEPPVVRGPLEKVIMRFEGEASKYREQPEESQT